MREALLDDDIFYSPGVVGILAAAYASADLTLLTQNLYNNLTYLYPNANIWIVGHSLGGALSSLLGATFGAPVGIFCYLSCNNMGNLYP